ncbi:MAG: hypothetical protein WC346_14115 [Methanogenium sp.]|jgi:hypothetical protein
MTLITPNVIRVVINPNLKFASGSIVSAVNTGDGEGSILKSSSGGVLTFKTLQAGTHINIVNNENEIVINSSGNVPDSRTINGYELTSNIVLTKDDLSLDQVDNTADGDKPLSSASILALDNKVDKNADITPGTFTKITFDEKGLVTNGTGSTTSDVEEVTDKRYVTDAHLVILGNTSGVNTGDETQTTIKQKLGSASVSQDGYLTKEDYEIFNSGSVGQNIGIGEGEVYKQKTGNILEFKTIKSGTNITVINNTDDVTIDNSNSVPYSGAVRDVNLGNKAISSLEYLKFNLVPSSVSVLPGTTYWDAADNTLATKITEDVTLQHGQEIHIKVVNKTETTLLNGQVVYINGAQENRPTVELAISTNLTASNILGVCTHDILDNQEGYVTVYGIVREINTSDYSTGDTLYLSNGIPGGFSNQVQSGSLYQTRIGITLNSTNNGSIFVCPKPTISLDPLFTLNSDLVSPSEKAIKTYVNSQIQASSSVTTASNLGLGESVFSQKVGNDLQFKTLVAGSSIIISSGSTEITISSTSSGSSGSGSIWGLISGNIEDQTDLYNELTTLSGSIVNRELLSNKSTDINLGTSNILYPTQNAVKTYVDTNISASSSVTTASNIGTGTGEVYSSSSGSVLQFKTIKAGTNITISNDTNEVTINSTASGSSGTGSIIIKSITYSSSSVAFQASDLGISMFEDCQVIKGHDNKYYMFLDDFSGNYNRDIYCVRSDSPDFFNPTYIGKIITRSNTRGGGVYYDNSNQEYIMFVNNFYSIGAGTPAIHTYSISQADFPSGTWVDNGSILTGGGPTSYDYEYMTSISSIINTGMSNLLYISSSHHRSTSLYSGGLAKINNKLSVSKFTNNPILTEKPSTVTKYNNSHFRTFIKIEGGYIGVYEALNTSIKWIVGAVFLDNSFTPVYELNESPFFEGDNQSFFNPNSNIIENNILYLYYQSTPLGQPDNFCIQNVAKFNLNY